MRIILIVLLMLPFVSADVYLNEINAVPFDDNSLYEWVEIYNFGDEVNLSGWKIGDERKNDSLEGALFYGQGMILESNSYAVITGSATRAYDNYNCSKNILKLYVGDNTIGYGRLSNSGEFVYLYDSYDDLIDFIEYPSLTKGETYSRKNLSVWWKSNPTMGYGNDENYIDYFEGECDWIVEVSLDSYTFDNDFEFKTIARNVIPSKSKLNLSRKIFNLNNKLVKEYSEVYFESSIRHTITNTPKLDEGVYFIETELVSDCKDFNLENNKDVKFFMILGNTKNSSDINIDSILDLGVDKKAETGQEIRVRFDIYMGDTDEDYFKIYLTENRNKVSKELKFVFDEEFYSNTLTIPFLINVDCGENDKTLNVVVEGFGEKDEEEFILKKCSKVKQNIVTLATFSNSSVEDNSISFEYTSSENKVDKLATPFFIISLLMLIIYLIFVKRKAL